MKDKKQRTEEENTRTTGAVMGGAILGASIYGPVGAIIGGIVGAVLGESVNDSRRGHDDGPPKSNRPGENHRYG
uniref:Glycine zipper n=1 Tax=Candidatus Kentrum sp. MB TaxID=2138164 RepID=A0A451BEN8_9GAMM|nr:MAG: hypothetical protein BECKMB1821G_GA0114241_100714 [Candidatus Kentron sp. MB]VFK34107.1 MAG: hypothetical protein BECKMB1821I_GA0114274_10617 [Candidatus Kentron sp. MB]VFK76742.1 MAG: hypothetical protein BECKMB1821H_GA0114242_10727 [Candidatus Kentron sp. MB]